MEYDSDKDPINSCMKLCKIAYTPFDWILLEFQK
jgi:hypothetical protein